MFYSVILVSTPDLFYNIMYSNFPSKNSLLHEERKIFNAIIHLKSNLALIAAVVARDDISLRLSCNVNNEFMLREVLDASLLGYHQLRQRSAPHL